MEMQDRKAIFFEEFVKRLIINSYQNLSEVTNSNIFEAIEKRALIPPVIAIQNRLKGKGIHEHPIDYKEIKQQPIQYQEFNHQELVKPVQTIGQKSIIQQIVVKKEIEPSIIPNRDNLPIMNRLIPILVDPFVQSINCPGPNKNVLITRRGIIQHTRMAFTTEEINNFMKEVSEKTKIPLLPGLFKVVYEDLIVTAVISEFVGTKFLVEKKIPQAFPTTQIQAPKRVQFK